MWLFLLVEIKYVNYYNKEHDLSENWNTNISSSIPKTLSNPNLLSDNAASLNDNQLHTSSPLYEDASAYSNSSMTSQHVSSNLETTQSTSNLSAAHHAVTPSYMYKPDGEKCFFLLFSIISSF